MGEPSFKNEVPFEDLDTKKRIILDLIDDQELREEIRAVLTSDLRDQNLLNMIAARLKTSCESKNMENGMRRDLIQTVTDSVRDQFFLKIKYLDVRNEFFE